MNFRLSTANILATFFATSLSLSALADSPQPYVTTYLEGVFLSRASTVTGLAEPRAGLRWSKPQFEVYSVGRFGADSRTLLDASDAIYNDNFVFLGMGMDYLGLFPGVRVLFQVGRSFDLNEKIRRAGFDLRSGTQSFHTLPWGETNLFSELYSEAFYIHRYRNAIGSVQFRTLHKTYILNRPRYQLSAGPLLTAVLSADTEGLDYNRFTEMHAGARLNYTGPVSLSLSPYAVVGKRWYKTESASGYTDFRLLLAGSLTF